MHPASTLPNGHPASAPAEPAWPGAAPAAPADRLVGRSRVLTALAARILAGEASFVTLVGVGGVGKSRLAAEISLAALDRFDGRVAVVPLDGVRDPTMVLPAIAGALGLAAEPGRPLADTIRSLLAGAPALLVLDTVEHLRPAAPELSALRERTDGLTILATSRIALGVPREHVVFVEPLDLPAAPAAAAAPVAPGRAAPLAPIASGAAPAAAQDPGEPAAVLAPALDLLLDRARAVRPDLAVTTANLAALEEISRRLDGIPLALELAAAALRVLTPHQLLDQLEQRVGGEGGALRATMDWSVGLLPPEVVRLYRRIGVIAGSFAPTTAASILERGDRRGLLPVGIDVEAGLAQLADASLLRRTDGGAAYAMLTTVRGDALARLDASGEAVAMHWAHAYEVLDVVEQAGRDMPTEREVAALDRLESAHDDIREALDWAARAGDGVFAVRLTGALTEFWRSRGHHTEGRLRLAEALAMAPDAPAAWRRRALGGAGLLASYQGDFVLAEAYLRQALLVAVAEDDEAAMAEVLNHLGTNAYGRGDLDAAEEAITRSVNLRRALDDPNGLAAALNALGGIYHFRGQLDRALEVFAESLALKEQSGSASALAVAHVNIGLVERDAGRPERAIEPFEEALRIWRAAGDRQRVAVALHNRALVDLDLHRYDAAAAGLREAYGIARDLGDRTEMGFALADLARVEVERGATRAAAEAITEAVPRVRAQGARIIVPLVLEAAGALAAARGEDEAAVRLWSAAAAERVATGFANMPADRRHLEEHLAEVRARLDPTVFAGTWADGWVLPPDDAAALALEIAAPEV